MNKRTFLGLALATPLMAPAAVQILNNYRVNGVVDLTAALAAGPVEALDETYEIGPTLIAPYDVIRGVPGRTRFLYQGDGPAFQPRDVTRPTDRVTLEGFDLICERRTDLGQHGVWMPSCRHWKLEDITIADFGGSGVAAVGKRTSDGVLAPSDATKHQLSNLRVLRAGGDGYLFTGTVATERQRGGTANMSTLLSCVASECGGDGFRIWQGAANSLIKCIAGLCQGNGFACAWWGNDFSGCIAEQNEKNGIWFHPTAAECKNNTVVGYHDGGGHVQQIANVGRNTVL